MLKNQNEGYAYNLALSAKKSFRQGFLMAAYSYSQSRNTVDAGSIALGSWTGNQMSGDPNNPGVSYSAKGHRAYLAGSYRFEYLNFGATTFSFFFEGFNAGTRATRSAAT